MCGELVYASMLLELWTMTLLYGLYIVLFIMCVYITVYRRPSKRGLAICVAMMICATAEVVLDLVKILLGPQVVSGSRLVTDSLFACDEATAAVRAEQMDMFNRVNDVSFIFFITKLALGDGVVVHRCWVLWDHRRWVAMIPAILLFVTIVCGYAQVGLEYKSYFVQLHSTGSPEDVANVIRIGRLLYDINTAITATSVATNVIVTGLIVFRIWRHTNELKETFGNQKGRLYDTAIHMVVESGALYTASLLMELISNNFTGSAAYLVNDLSDSFTAMLVVIAPSLIMIRVGLGIGYKETTQTQAHTHTKTDHFLVFASPKSQGETTTSGINAHSMTMNHSSTMNELNKNESWSPAEESMSSSNGPDHLESPRKDIET